MGKKILLADDSITIQKVIELTFSDEDFEVVTVGNGRLAIERVQEVRPDLVLCDIIMPEKDGYEVCDFIKKNPGLSHVPVLLLTGAFEPFDKEKAGRVRADGYLAKPFEPQALISRVRQLLSQAGAPAPAAPLAAPPVAAPVAAPAAAPVAAPAAAPAAAATVAMPAVAAPRPPAPPPSVAPAPRPVPVPPAAVAAPTPPPPTPAPVVPAFVDDEPAFIPEEPVFAAEPVVAAPAEAPEPAELLIDDGLSYMDDSFEPIPEEAVAIARPAPDSSTVMFKAPDAWSQSTIEVPIETRARASIASALAVPPPPAYEEIFEPIDEHEQPGLVEHEAAPLPEPVDESPAEEPAELVASAVAPVAPAASFEQLPEPEPEPFAFPGLEPEAAPEPESDLLSGQGVVSATAPEPTPELPEASFAGMADLGEPVQAPAASVAAETKVPVEMVEQIAQRVVAQVSEKIVREIAWEVIPDMAEALIKQEIARLRAELEKI